MFVRLFPIIRFDMLVFIDLFIVFRDLFNFFRDLFNGFLKQGGRLSSKYKAQISIRMESMLGLFIKAVKAILVISTTSFSAAFTLARDVQFSRQDMSAGYFIML